ncbi:MAG TPA: M81 family metallopeptidase [Burkholderiales bacterium]|nr:M81 family metallopeptidase [Burkholderiales bacterium]
MATLMQRIAVCRLWHEGNSFTPVPTTLAEFRNREWYEGEAVPAFYRGTRTEIGAAVDFFAANRALTPIWLRCAAAPPGGPVEQASLDAICREIVDGVREAGADAVYLSLHGALLGTESVAADLALLTDVRGAMRDKRIAVSFDLHANLDPAIANLVNVLVGYKTHPHVDMYETGLKALQLLIQAKQPVVAIAKVGAVLPSFNMRTADGPMAEMEALAARAKALDATPFGGFAYADTPCAGASVAVTTEGEGAEALAEELAREMYRRRARFAVRLPSPASALNDLRVGGKPVAIVEPSDNPLSGGVGDTTGLLRALIDHGVRQPSVFAFFWDPDLAARCRPGERMEVKLGARLSAVWGPPVALQVEVERVTDGRFRNAGPMEEALEVNLGRTAVLRAGELRIIVTSSCQAPNDVEYFRLHGIEIPQMKLVCAKAKNHFRAAFAPLVERIIDVDTIGPAMADLSRLPWRHVPASLIELGA